MRLGRTFQRFGAVTEKVRMPNTVWVWSTANVHGSSAISLGIRGAHGTLIGWLVKI